MTAEQLSAIRSSSMQREIPSGAPFNSGPWVSAGCHSTFNRIAEPKLRLSWKAYLQWTFLGHCGGTEVGMFGVAIGTDPLFIDHFRVVKQTAGMANFAMDSTAVADYVDEMDEKGIPDFCCKRVWCHTHPMESPHPSGVDENTFADSFSHETWAVMGILGSTGRTYARLVLRAGLQFSGGGSRNEFAHIQPIAMEKVLEVEVDWKSMPNDLQVTDIGQLKEEWMQSYKDNVVSFSQPTYHEYRGYHPPERQYPYQYPGQGMVDISAEDKSQIEERNQRRMLPSYVPFEGTSYD